MLLGCFLEDTHPWQANPWASASLVPFVRMNRHYECLLRKQMLIFKMRIYLLANISATSAFLSWRHQKASLNKTDHRSHF